ncbi:solute carrier family 35 member G1 [Leptopilina heterotoma]|uniref:solute carrier family 35 member G1 n=1 Tax=Leptopilina heterotoma TaxID=63436 RepID=UPI001CA9FAC8|nr:solute carrier family 35 member G1 [Leptopilina heterotoma]XP_043473664.1 solute carrier family 35 member G1 [Leptopilina heterotoma]XP_043473665.1 solute carrier family 35 member G1 [Leptopilina heterotoma]XP_043473666.1 solute carrier family 35 member G1 [Leptopilina heterotoma]
MPEHVELQHLVDGDIERHNKSTIFRKKFYPKCKTCPYLGLVLATVSSLFFSLCSVIVKGLVDINPMELAAFRFVGVLLPTIPILIYKGEHPFPRGRRFMLILRSFVGTTGLMLSFYAFRHMPLADASVVVFSVPVFVAIFARIFLKEPCGLFNVITVCLTLIGVILITRPPLIFGHTVESLSDSQIETDIPDVWGAIAAFSATIFGANAYVLLRALKGLHFSVIMTNFGSFALIQTVMYSWLIGALCLPRCGTDRLLVVALAFFSFGGQILLTLALQMEQAGPVAIARSADIVFAFLWQVLFFNEIPNKYSIGGAILVTSSVLLTGLRKWAISLPENSTLKKSLGILAM